MRVNPPRAAGSATRVSVAASIVVSKAIELEENRRMP
jgi:hypothetical protein